MKKLAAIALTLALALSLAACGASAPAADPGQSAPAQSAPAAPSAPASPAAPAKVQYVLENEVVVDNDACTVTLVGGETTRSGDVEFKFLLENKTGDQNLAFYMDPTAVNDWEIMTMFGSVVTPGKKANETLTFNAKDLEEVGLTAVDKLRFGLRVFDDDDWMADALVDDTFILYPTGLSADQVVSPDRPAGEDEMIAVDTEECAYVILGTRQEEIWGYVVDVFLENRTADKDLSFSWENVSVNGMMIEPYALDSAASGDKNLSSVSFSAEELAKNSIALDQVEEIEFTLRVFDAENWMGDDVLKETFVYRPTK